MTIEKLIRDLGGIDASVISKDSSTDLSNLLLVRILSLLASDSLSTYSYMLSLATYCMQVAVQK